MCPTCDNQEIKEHFFSSLWSSKWWRQDLHQTDGDTIPESYESVKSSLFLRDETSIATLRFTPFVQLLSVVDWKQLRHEPIVVPFLSFLLLILYYYIGSCLSIIPEMTQWTRPFSLEKKKRYHSQSSTGLLNQLQPLAFMCATEEFVLVLHWVRTLKFDDLEWSIIYTIHARCLTNMLHFLNVLG